MNHPNIGMKLKPCLVLFSSDQNLTLLSINAWKVGIQMWHWTKMGWCLNADFHDNKILPWLQLPCQIKLLFDVKYSKYLFSTI